MFSSGVLLQAKPGKANVDEHSQNGGERAEKNDQLENNDQERRNGNNRLSARYQRIMKRCADGQNEGGYATEEAAAKGEASNGALLRLEGLFDLMAWDRRENGKIAVAHIPELLNRRSQRIQMGESADDAHGASPHDEPPFSGGGAISFTSVRETTGRSFANSKNHKKNQATSPARMLTSTQVGR